MNPTERTLTGLFLRAAQANLRDALETVRESADRDLAVDLDDALGRVTALLERVER